MANRTASKRRRHFSTDPFVLYRYPLYYREHERLANKPKNLSYLSMEIVEKEVWQQLGELLHKRFGTIRHYRMPMLLSEH